jgi:hypothetical protein
VLNLIFQKEESKVLSHEGLLLASVSSDFEKVPQKELTLFGTKEEAERAGYRAAQNCP